MATAATIIPIPPQSSKYLRNSITPPLLVAISSEPDQNRASRWFRRAKEQAEDLAEDEFFDRDGDRQREEQSCDDGDECN
jgi:hypothetical protein